MSYHEITPKQLAAIMPYVSAIHIEQFIEPLNAAMHEFGIDTPKRQAAFLAQIAHESGSLRYVRELADGKAYDGRQSLGNTHPEAIAIAAEKGTTPGPFYKGRGLIQITGFANYSACGKALFGDKAVLTVNPALLERPDLACRSAAWYWDSRGLNALSDAGDFEAITRRINGGLNGQADRVAYHKRALAALAVDTGGGAEAPAPFPQNPPQKKEKPSWLHSLWQRFRRS
jgi:putative chitinase